MIQHRTYRAFFSYARADAVADPRLIAALTSDLQRRVDIKLTNDRFEIWRDVENLRLGDKWEPKLEAELRSSDVLIVLLTPRWLGSENCRKEYEIFEEVESGRGTEGFAVSYVAVILARDVEKEKSKLTDEQASLLNAIRTRQYERLLATDFLSLSKSKRTAIVDGIADDIYGIIERRRTIPEKTLAGTTIDKKRYSQKREYDLQALNYEDVDFISNAEVIVDRRNMDQPIVYAQVDFVHRLYIQGDVGRVEFGVRRAYLRITNDGPGELIKVHELKGGKMQNVSYVSLHDAPSELAVCMDPAPGKPSLAELALPPAENENYLSKMATTTNEVATNQLRAELQVMLNTEGLYLTSGEQRIPTQRTLKHIKTIVDIVVTKATGSQDQSIVQTKKLRRPVRVIDRT